MAKKDPTKRNLLHQLQVQMSSQHEFFYNISKVDMEGQYWQRLILFLGEGGQFVTTSMNEILYVGGFMGNMFNNKLGQFRTISGKFEYERYYDANPLDPKAAAEANMALARMGHLAFWDYSDDKLILFAGQQLGAHVHGRAATKQLLNDVVIYDVETMRMSDQIVFSDVDLCKRIYHAGFKINDSIFSIGGIRNDGTVLDEFMEVDIRTRKTK